MSQPVDHPGTPTSFTSTAPSLPCPIRSGELVKPGTVASQIRKWDQRVHHQVAHPRYHVSSLWSNGLQPRVKQLPPSSQIYGNPLAASSTPVLPTTQPFSPHDPFFEAGTRSSFGKRHGGGWAPPAGRRISARNRDELAGDVAAAVKTVDAQNSPRGRPRALSSTVRHVRMPSSNGQTTPSIPDEQPSHVSDIAEETESQLGVGQQTGNEAIAGVRPSRALTPAQYLSPPNAQPGTARERSPSTGRSQPVEQAPSPPVSAQPFSDPAANSKRSAKTANHSRGQHSLSKLDTGKKTSSQARRVSDSNSARRSETQHGQPQAMEPEAIDQGQRTIRRETSKPAKPTSSRSTSKRPESRSQQIMGGPLFWSPDSYGSQRSAYHDRDAMQSLDDRLLAQGEHEWRRFSYASDLDEHPSPGRINAQPPRTQTPSQASLRALLHPRDSTETLKGGGQQSSPNLRKQASSGLLSLIPRFFSRTEPSPSPSPEASPEPPQLQSPFRPDPVGQRPSQRPQSHTGQGGEITPVPTPVTPSARVSDNDSQDVHPPTISSGDQESRSIRPKLQKSVDNSAHATRESKSKGQSEDHQTSSRIEVQPAKHVSRVSDSGSPSRRTSRATSRHPSTTTHRVSIIDSQGGQSTGGGDPAKTKHIHIMVSRDEWIDVQMSIRVQPRSTNGNGNGTGNGSQRTHGSSRGTSVSVHPIGGDTSQE